MSASLPVWLDAVYAVWVDMMLLPERLLDKVASEMLRKSAMMRPEEFRKDWGRLPIQQALAGNLGKGPGVEAGSAAGAAPDQKALRERWDRIQERNTRSLRNPRG